MLWLLPLASAATWRVALDGSGEFSSLQAAVDAAADGDVLEVGPGEWHGPILLNRRRLSLISTAGPDTTILDGSDAQSLIRAYYSDVELDGFTLVNPTASGIYSVGSTLRLHDLMVGGMGYNQAAHAPLEIDGGVVEVDQCIFSDNGAINGGHIHLEDGTLSVLNSSFYSGKATDGGAISGGSNVQVSVEGSQFIDNYAHAGGAISLGRNSDLRISNTIFRENWGESRGGAVLVDQGSTVSIVGGLFEENFAKAGAGVVVEDDSTLVVDGVDFEYNTSVGRAGGIWALWGSKVDVGNSSFVGNSANFGYGGAIQAWGPVSSHNNYFKANFSRLWGGGIYVYGAGFTDSDSEFSDNTTTSNYGGGLVVEEADYLTLSGSLFVQNNAAQGGGVAALDAGKFRISNVTFDDNFARGNGGGLFVRETPVTLKNTVFTENVAGVNGGGIYAETGSDLTIEGGRFADQKAGGDGGSIRLYDGTSADIRHTPFTWSVAGGSGGTLSVDALSDTDFFLIMEDDRISDSTAGAQGGSIAIYHILDVELQQVDMIRSTGGEESFGGAAYFEGIGELQVHNGRFSGNTGGYGGAVYTNGIWSASEQWTNNIFDANHALYGGAICLVNGEGTRFWNNTLVGNSAEVEAGAVCFHRNTLDFRNNLVTGTTGGAGLHAYSLTNQEAVIFNDWWNNEAGDVGGNWSIIPGDRNMQADPELVLWNSDDDETNDMLVPMVGSPLIDAGDPYLKDADGTRSDIGAFGGPQFVAEDKDGDGISSQSDCDDHNPSIYPGAPEVDYDGIDQDCNGGESDDVDGDGLTAKRLGGPDCDDHNQFIRECAEDEEKKGCATAPSPVWMGLVGVALALRRRGYRAD